MNLKELGEFGFIDKIEPKFKNLIKASQIGIGDDCAILPFNEKEDYLYTTDLLIENVHFLKNDIDPKDLGYKSLAVNISDIAAMGGTPVGSFMSIAIPSGYDVEYLDKFIEGYTELSEKYNIPLLGGDTTSSMKDLAINIGIIGTCPKGKALLRSTTTPDDVICTTGNLGDSNAGLRIILEGLKNDISENSSDSQDLKYLLKKHYRPEARIEQGKFLASQKGVNAMMDISDGIASDLKHMLNKNKNAIINLDVLPFSDSLIRIAKVKNWKPIEMAIGGGEDYELLFTVHYENYQELLKNYQEKFGETFFPIGNITKGEGLVMWYSKGKEVKIKTKGYNHF